MTEKERKLTSKVVKSKIERTESGGERPMVALELLGGERERGRRVAERGRRVAECCEKGDSERLRAEE
jgi:hypothetical protein